MPPARSPRSKKQMHNKKQMRAVPGHHLWPGYASVHVHYHITFHRHSRIIHPLSTGKQVKCTSSKMLHSFHLTQPTKCFTTNNVPDMASPHLPLQYTWKAQDTSHGFNYALHVLNQVICPKTDKQTKADTSKLPWLLINKHKYYPCSMYVERRGSHSIG